VNRFFDPLTAHNVDVVEKAEQARDFFAYINQNGTLVNEGIVATGAFISMLVGEGAARRLFRAQDGDRGYVALQIGQTSGSMLVGLRKLGLANLKVSDGCRSMKSWTASSGSTPPGRDARHRPVGRPGRDSAATKRELVQRTPVPVERLRARR
jgi:hypothetical protein